ncbi:MAG: hypothetical protein WCJ63_07865 [Actinomycetes bacterium]
MKTPLRLALLVSFSALLLTACGGGSGTSSTSSSASAVPTAVSSTLADRGASGEAIANGWFGLLEAAAGKADVVKPYLDPAYQLQRDSGERFLASSEVPRDIRKFTLSKVVVTQPTDEIRVVRYRASTPGVTTPADEDALSDSFEPRLSVFRWDKGRGHWVVVSDADFSTPVAAACSQTSFKETTEKPTTSAQDVATGEALVNEWRDIAIGKIKKFVRDPQNQIQLGSGWGWPTPGAAKIKWSPAKNYEPKYVVITRNDNLLVASYSAVTAGQIVEGTKHAEALSPRLLTYRLNDQNEWKLIALANFNTPKDLPKGTKCPPGHGA